MSRFLLCNEALLEGLAYASKWPNPLSKPQILFDKRILLLLFHKYGLYFYMCMSSLSTFFFFKKNQYIILWVSERCLKYSVMGFSQVWTSCAKNRVSPIMRLVILDNYDLASEWAAKYICNCIVKFKPGQDRYFSLGLPTGINHAFYFIYSHYIRLRKLFFLLKYFSLSFCIAEHISI